MSFTFKLKKNKECQIRGPGLEGPNVLGLLIVELDLLD
jgi:hypothetical protein